MLTYDSEDGSVRLVIFKDDPIMTSVFMISVAAIIVANIHVLVLLNIILFIVLLVLALAIVIAAFLSPVLLLIYLTPVVACMPWLLHSLL